MEKDRVLIVDNEPKICSILSALLTRNGYEVQIANSGEDGVDVFAKFKPVVILLDLKMPGMDGIEVMDILTKRFHIDYQIIIMTAHGKIRSAVEAIKKGAFDYLQKPFDNDELLAVISKAIEVIKLKRRVKQLEDQLEETYGFESIIGISDKLKSIFTLMSKFAAADGTVLVSGESGTGKELVIRAIHQASNRKTAPFIVVNCGAIPQNLIENEFFGHEAGSFTDAKELRRGKFESADGGTLFLDEVGELPLEAQVKLLRVIEEGTFFRVGGNKPVFVDVRVMAATNRDIAAMVKQGTFREDLYWRLNVLSLHICPLRERKEDIPLLVDNFLDRYAGPLGIEQPKVSERVMELLTAYEWPGNVRELQNCIYSAMTIASGSIIEPSDFLEPIYSESKQSDIPGITGSPSLAQIAAESTAKAEKAAIKKALSESGGNREKAADLLGIGRKTLYRKLKQYGIK